MTEREIFLAALKQPSPGERAAFLDQACGADASLRVQIEALLAEHEKLGSYLESPVGAGQRTVDQPPVAELPGTVIGPYKLLQQIGEGGMGTVFMAEQTAPLQRRVALKLIKPGMDSRLVLARFEAERQALALMDHVNIARVLDAGATDSGRPYFVMELVHGVPITTYCDDHHLTPRERLELFVPVCQAIQHAHQKGIIHRDIKPSNVMITLYDGKPVPKVIDFGVAKATEQKLTERTLFTQYGTMVGTLEYMSPEQAEMSALGVDTRSDIYSLGVLLYELLTGSTPLDRKRMREAVYGEILRLIKEEEPPKPSTRLSEAGAALASISAQRHMEPAKLAKLMRGELDWIVMKTLEKDRNRRYETASGFAADVQRYLNDEAVQACPPSALYRFRKFARRHKVGLTIAGLVAASLVLTIAVLAISNVWVMWERDQKTQALTDKEAALLKESVALAKAQEQEGLAKTQKELAEAEAKRAREQERASRQQLYATRLALIEPSLERGNVGQALRLLEAERPRPDRDDLRGFEWYHFWWRCHQGHRLTLRGHRGAVLSVAFSPDGKSLASGNRDGTVSFWDVATGQARTTLKGHVGPIRSVAFSPDGATFASCGGDTSSKLWLLATGRERTALRGHAADVMSVAFSPSGATLATSSGDNTVKLWDVATGHARGSFQAGQSKPPSTAYHFAAFSPDGKTLAALDTYAVKLWDVATGQERSTKIGDRIGVQSLAFAPDGKRMATTAAQGGVKVWDLSTGQEQASLKGRAVSQVTFSPDGKILAFGSPSGTLTLWNPATGQERAYGHVGLVRSVAFSPDGKTVASASDDGTVKLWDVSLAPPQPALLRHGSMVWSVAFSPDGKTAASAGDFRVVKLWDVATEQELASLAGHTAPVIGVTFSPNGKTLASCGDDTTIRLWDLSTRQELALLKGHTEPVYSVAFSPDGKTLASGSKDQTVKLWDLVAKKERARLCGHQDWIWVVAFSPDGKTVASGCDDRTIKLWDARAGRERGTLRGHLSAVRSFAFSSDGNTLFSTSFYDGTVRLWDAATGQQRTSRMQLGLTALSCPVPLPDQRSLVIAHEGDIKVLDLGTGRERVTLKGHTQRVISVALSPDGKTLATGSWDGTVKFWRTATEQEVRAQSSVSDEKE